MRSSRLVRDLAELAWASSWMNVIILLTGALISTYVGRPAMLLAVAFAALVTLTMAVLAAANLLLIGALRLRDRRGRAEGIPRSTVP